jgi:serine/threonine protein kinase
MTELTMRLHAALAGRYRIERELGAGGMATVYLARDLKHDRDVAVKVLRPELAAVLGGHRFLNEIRISAQLDHPHILTLIDSGTADGFLYYVMPFVRGESLRDKLKREKQLRVDEALDITRQVTSALDYAHRQGIVHRDIKPENILIREGEAVLADFGIAVAVKEAGGNRLTESGVSLGTPQYMSPEQATGDRELDPRSDVYSIAAVLYEMLAGEPPHSGASVQAVIAKLLIERPTRLRVIRDTVPEAVDSAVAKALAKLPADRYATAGDFARALVTGAPPERTSAASRRRITIAIGGAVTLAAAIGAALILGRKSAPPPLPDTVQLTFTGNAVSPSLSRDGTRLAFGEKQCDSAGSCTYRLVIQDIDGSSRLPVARNIGYIYQTEWTSDGLLVEFAGSYPPLRNGAFAVSTLGGEPRYLGLGKFGLISGDTAFLNLGQTFRDRTWLRRITARDGRTIDSIRIRDEGFQYGAIPLTIPDRLIVALQRTSDSAELHLTDFRGRVISRSPKAFWPVNGVRFHWVAKRQKLVVAIPLEPFGTEFEIVSMNVTPSGIATDVDTLVSHMQLGNGVGAGAFDVSADGERLVYSSGPVETSLTTIDVDRTASTRLAVTPESFSTTTRLRGRLSPAGDQILLARDAPRAGVHASQFSIRPRNGGSESQIPGAVENLLDFQWSLDGARIMYLCETGRNGIQLMEMDTTGRDPREIVRLGQSAATYFQPLPDGSVWTMPADRRSISIHRPGKPDVTWQLPPWILVLGSNSHSRDAKTLLVHGVHRSADSVVVATMDIASGSFTRVAAFAGSDPIGIRWLADGTIMQISREPQGAWAFHRIRRGFPAEKLGVLPHTRADFSISNDGKHVAMFRYVDKNDVYMIRNFGKILR